MAEEEKPKKPARAKRQRFEVLIASQFGGPNSPLYKVGHSVLLAESTAAGYIEARRIQKEERDKEEWGKPEGVEHVPGQTYEETHAQSENVTPVDDGDDGDEDGE